MMNFSLTKSRTKKTKQNIYVLLGNLLNYTLTIHAGKSLSYKISGDIFIHISYNF